MRKDIKISIIVPVYNVKAYLERCFESILKQTYTNIEVVAVDDGSTDGSSEILDEYAKKDVRIVPIHKENGGVTSARLTGVRMSTGEYIGFVDGDDEIELDMYEKLLKNALAYKADISHCGYRMIFNNREDLYYGTGRLVKQNKQAGLKDLLDGSFIEPGLWNKLFRKTLFHSLLHDRVMDLSIKNNEDLLMNYYLFREAECSIFEDVCLYHYIVHSDSAANKSLNDHQLLDPLRVTKNLMSETDGNVELNHIVEKKYIRQLIVLASMSINNNPELICPNKKKALSELRVNLIKIVLGKNYGLKLKVMSIWVSVLPSTYRFVHTLYEKITGLDRKYDME